MHARYPLSPPSGRFSPPRRARLAALGLAAVLSASGLSGCGSASGAGSAAVTMWTFKQSHLQQLSAQNVPQYNSLMAGALIVVIPVILLFLALQRYFVNGLVGAVKG
ncbi:hypothetical protein Strvi_5961 [Streptomyces violaceusniger Tu 4113]|uniref:ABC transmembrane type-1 domain-containing protein n=1 Tax=Streptomyces violaceusniger (strain Tu 4113) TaxID=653045 RepID=G2PG89_STRV4|nr:hypothetical protein Strvi_5961 [Streptomyces violaceusniger Tu 4113]